MAGVEAAGFVLAAVPIVLQLLEQYKEGLDRTAVIFRRRKHVEKLGHALLMQRALLGANLKSLLLDSGVDGAADVLDDPFGVLSADGVEDTLEDYLGKDNYQAYSYALMQCKNSVKEVTGSLEGFGTDLGSLSGDLVAVIKANADAKKGTLDIRKRVNLTLRKDGVEKAIQELDKSTGGLERLQKLITANHTSAAASTSRRSNKSASLLHRVRQVAERLHAAFAQHWASGCHDVHEVKLLLDDRLDLNPSHGLSKKKTISFELSVSSDWDDPRPLWHETVVEAPVDEEDDDMPANATVAVALVPPVPTSGTRVSLVIPQTTHTTLIQVQSICVSIDRALVGKKTLRLYVSKQCQLSCDHILLRKSHWSQNRSTTTLEKLLVVGSRERIALRRRMTLAVNLASSLLQLQNTPWLRGTCWTKTSVNFATVPTQSASQSQHQGPRSCDTVDTSKPFVRNTFPDPRLVQKTQTRTDAKSALLELGIILLELWHETAFEDRYPQAANTSEYLVRFQLAWEWLDDVNNPPPDLYTSAIAQCVKCFFGGKTVSFDWDDMNFLRAICQDIIDPLHKTCKQWM